MYNGYEEYNLQNGYDIYDILRKYINNPNNHNTNDLDKLLLFLQTYKSKLSKNKDTNTTIFINYDNLKKIYIKTLDLKMCDRRNCFLTIDGVNNLLNEIKYINNYYKRYKYKPNLDNIIEGGKKYRRNILK